MKNWKYFGAVALVIVAGACIIMMRNSGEQVHAVRVQRQAITAYVDEQGKTRLPVVHRITMPFAARIEPIEVVEGERVWRKQVVARIVQSDLEIALEQARATVNRYVASIAENQHNVVEERARQQAIEMVESMVKTAEAAEARLTASKSRLEFATRFRQDAERLFQENAVSETEFERAQLDEVESQVQYAQDALAWQAATSLRKATELLPQIIDAYVNRKEMTRAVLENQKAEAEAQLKEVLTRQRRGTMRSPVDGLVLERMVTNEQYLPGGAELLTIGDPSQLQVEVDVLTLDVGEIELGDRALIYGPAVGVNEEKGLPGVVQRIYPAGFTKISSLGVEQQRVKVIVDFAEGVLNDLLQRRELGVDFRVRVQIVTASQPDALVVPRSALFRSPDGQWQVFAVRRSRAHRQNVHVGLMNDRQVEIRQGLRENEYVIVAPESDLRSGRRVHFSQP